MNVTIIEIVDSALAMAVVAALHMRIFINVTNIKR